MKYPLFISDFDWTLGNSPDYIAKETVEAIKEYIKKGGNFCIVTGRSYSSIKEICLKHGITCLVGCFQGAKIVDMANDKVLFDGGIDFRVASRIVSEIEKDDVDVIAWVDDTLIYSKDSYYSNMYQNTEKVFVNKVKGISNEILKIKKSVSKLCVVCEENQTDKLIEKYCKKYQKECIINSGAKRLVEFINPKYTKGYAVKLIADYFNTSLDKIITVGDSSNDIELVEGVWHGVAVGNALDVLKQKAKEITVDYLDQPVKYLLEKYCL